MLGSLSEADDAVQEAWPHVSRAASGVKNMSGWLTTIVARVCLNMLEFTLPMDRSDVRVR